MRDEEDDDYRHAEIPTKIRDFRACMTCSLLKTFSQFYDMGCENCPFLQLQENRQRVTECTSAYFEGVISMMEPKESWVAKWQRIVRLVPGIYAVTVSGELPENIRHYLEERNIAYRVQ